MNSLPRPTVQDIYTTHRHELLDFLAALHLIALGATHEEGTAHVEDAFQHCARFLDQWDTRLYAALEQGGAL